MIYFVAQEEESGSYVKIGYTSEDPMGRLNACQVGNPIKLRLIGCFPGDKLTEEHLHKFWEQWHVRGEWFRLDEEVFGFIHRLIHNDIVDVIHGLLESQESAKVQDTDKVIPIKEGFDGSS